MKTIIKKSLLVLVSLVAIYFVIFLVQSYLLEKSYRDNYIPVKAGGIVNSNLIRCNYDILNPKIADVYRGEGQEKLDISFHAPNKLFSASKLEWRESYTGGTTIKNTTFPQLLKMVKEDCSQFQKSKGDRNDKDINWSYGKYEPKPEKTKEEIEALKIEKEEKMKKIKSGEIKRGVLEGFVEYNEDGTIKNEN